jgi:hypothetical protein
MLLCSWTKDYQENKNNITENRHLFLNMGFELKGVCFGMTRTTKALIVHLSLEAAGGTTTTGLLELATLALDVGLGVLAGAHAEVLDGLTGVLLTAEEDGVGTGGGTESQLVEGDDLTAGLQDASLGGLGDAQAGNRQLGDLEEAVVVSDGSDNDGGLAILTSHVAGNTGNRHGGAVDARHKEALQNDLVEGRVRAAGKESVELLGVSSWNGEKSSGVS